MYSGGVIAANRRRTAEEDIWGLPYEEALIQPPPSTERSTYAFSGQTAVLSQTAWATAASEIVPYDHCVLLKDRGQLPPDYPVDLLIYFSTDHSSTDGAISVACGMRDAGEPSLFQILDYPDAVAAGWLDSIPDKPSGDYLFKIPLKQSETPWTWWDAINAGIMYFQAFVSGYASPSYRGNQATYKATSTNMLTWTLGTEVINPVPTSECVGDGHCGYFRFAPNILPDVPYDYLGYSLAAGTDKSRHAQWGSDSPAGPWTLLGILGPVDGRAVVDMPTDWTLSWRSLDPRSIRKTRQGYTAIMEAQELGSGAAVVPGALYEVPISSDGRSIVGKPIEVIAPVALSFSEDKTAHCVLIDDVENDRRLSFFLGITDNPSKANTVAISASPLRNPGNTYYEPLVPSSDGATLLLNLDFRGLSALPSELEIASAGTTSSSFDANGMNITANATTGILAVFESIGFIPQDYDYVRIEVINCRSLLTDNYARIMVGFDTAKNTAQSNAVRVASSTSATEGVGGLISAQEWIAGSVVVNPGNDVRRPGILRGDGDGGRRFTLGYEWWPNAGKMCFTDEGQEGRLYDLNGTRDLNVSHYPYFAFSANTSTKNISVRVEQLRIWVKAA